MGSDRVRSEQQQPPHNKAARDVPVGTPISSPELSPSVVPDTRLPLRNGQRVCPENGSEFQDAPLANPGAGCRSGLVPKKGTTSRYTETPAIKKAE